LHSRFIVSAEIPANEARAIGELPIALRGGVHVEFDHPVTFFVGDNGSGKSTLVEALAIAVGLNAEGGTRNMSFSFRPTESRLHEAVRLVRSHRRPRNAFFLRAETFFNLASQVEEYGVSGAYGTTALHDLSHGESMLSVILHRFGPSGLYLMDEPEAALSVRGQLALMRRMHELVDEESQFIIATHSPILLAYPDADIVELTPSGLEHVEYRDTENFQLTQRFLADPTVFLRNLFETDDDSERGSDPSPPAAPDYEDVIQGAPGEDA
jgi:predicted ATPase